MKDALNASNQTLHGEMKKMVDRCIVLCSEKINVAEKEFSIQPKMSMVLIFEEKLDTAMGLLEILSEASLIQSQEFPEETRVEDWEVEDWERIKFAKRGYAFKDIRLDIGDVYAVFPEVKSRIEKAEEEYERHWDCVLDLIED